MYRFVSNSGLFGEQGGKPDQTLRFSLNKKCYYRCSKIKFPFKSITLSLWNIPDIIKISIISNSFED